MTKKKHEDFESSTNYWISKTYFEEGKVNSNNHDHITGKYWGFAHQDCNLNLSWNQKIPAVFHNLQNYESHLIIQKIGKYHFSVNVTPKK